ncbi:FadR/GntR family transcriptional regulator [Streptomyces sp. UG1]|uniref:FadR/GntR family transcriptional regulator n=1 Tax=Streptomyces sp. UG1 TaxID=3417652 RepID=UPI003CEAD20B
MIAYQLEREIVAKGFPVGEVLGSEADLIARLGISRAVLREAVRVLEHHGVATMRRGPGGGLVVTEPDSESAVRASALMLEFTKASPQHVFEARLALELKCVELATAKIDEPGIVRLRETLALEQEMQHQGGLGSHDLHTVLAELTGNPALVLFVEVLTNLSNTARSRESTPRAAADVRIAHDKIAEAVIAGDAALARHRMQAHLAAIGKWLARPDGKSGSTQRRPDGSEQ